MIRSAPGALSLDALWGRIIAGGRADFMVLPDTRLRYAALETAARRWLACFDSAGLEAGDRVLIRVSDDFAAASAFIAALLDGLVPVLLTAETPDTRALSLLRTVEARLVVVDHGRALPADGVGTVTLGAPSTNGRGLFGGKARDRLSGLDGAPAKRSPRLPTDESGLAYILFTSGTTSSPSGVMVTRGNLLANLATLSRLFGYDAGSRIFNDMILAHADGLVQGPLLALTNGCAVIRSGGFRLNDLEPWLNRVRAERATHVITVPTIWAMIEAYARHDDYFDAPECRSLLSVAAKLPDALWETLERRFERPVFNQYGLTETVTSALYAGPGPEMGGFGTIGRPIDCEARIDPAAASAGEGELQLRGANIFPGYWRNPERTAASFTADGWLRTGDLVRLRADGFYEILGRLKTVITMGGFLIRPDEIDEVMLTHPAVRESVTVAVEDEMFGEVPITAVVCGEAADEAALTAHARANLEGRKVPKRILTLVAIPRGDSGKPRLGAVRELLVAAITGAAAPKTASADIDEAVRALAAEVFRVPPETMTAELGPGDVPGWDSFSQLNFVMAAEGRFDVIIPVSRMVAIRTVADMARAIRDLRT